MTTHYDDRPLCYDDTYTGPRWVYGLTYRPLSASNVPSDWIIFSDRPHPAFRHGTVQYPRELSVDETAAFQLTALCHCGAALEADGYCPQCAASTDDPGLEALLNGLANEPPLTEDEVTRFEAADLRRMERR